MIRASVEEQSCFYNNCLMFSVTIMKSPIEKLLLIFVLCIISSSYILNVKAENKVTVNSINVDVSNEDILESWDASISNNLISITPKIKKDCPSILKIDIKIYQNDQLVSQMTKQFEKPFKDLENANLCTSVEYIDEDDACSIAPGEQNASDCDVSSMFNSMNPGNYKTVCEMMESDTLFATATLEVTVEE
ncbi:uncharacterized protein LOC108003090 [Apis cerana]|uniref:uncharacterized protein LOC108003090 n=1 Tax=Apis cerana TaxID=7461 RepID=UPI0007E2CEDA|nr:uncharacterized protein LOC108003090 [Apis cerana]